MVATNTQQPQKKGGKTIWIVGGIAVVIIVAGLLLFGMRSSPQPVLLGSSCISAPGYVCLNATIHNGNLAFTFAQSTGFNWAQANIFMVYSGSPNPTAVPPLPCEEGFPNGITSGQYVNVVLPSYASSDVCIGFPNTAGQAVTGALWVGYQNSSTGTEQFVEIGTISATTS